MAENNYTREIVVKNTPNAAFLALTSEFDKWWTPGSKAVGAVGDIIVFRFNIGVPIIGECF